MTSVVTDDSLPDEVDDGSKSSGGKIGDGSKSSGGKVDSEPMFTSQIPLTVREIFRDILKLARFVCNIQYGDKADENYKKFQESFMAFSEKVIFDGAHTIRVADSEVSCPRSDEIHTAVIILQCWAQHLPSEAHFDRTIIRDLIKRYNGFRMQDQLANPKTPSSLREDYRISDSIDSDFTYEEIGVPIPGCMSLVSCSMGFDQTHDAFGGRAEGVTKPELALAKQVLALDQSRIEATSFSPVLAFSSSTPTPVQDQIKRMNRRAYNTAQAIAGEMSYEERQTDSEVKKIIRKQAESSESFIQYFTVCSFVRWTREYEERGLVIVALPPGSTRNEIAKSMAVKLFGNKDTLYSSDNGSAETLLLLQTQPFIFNRLKDYMALAARNIEKTMILSSFFRFEHHQRVVRVSNTTKDSQLRRSERKSNRLRSRCYDAQSFMLTYDMLPEWKAPLAYLKEIAHQELPIQTLFHLKENMFETESPQPTLTIEEEMMKKRYLDFRRTVKTTGRIDFPGEFVMLGGRRRRRREGNSFSYLNPEQLIFCPQFSQNDMHSGGNPLNANFDLAQHGLTTSWPMNGCTPALGQTLGLRMLSETTVTVVDLAKPLFKQGWVDEEWKTARRALQYKSPNEEDLENMLQNTEPRWAIAKSYQVSLNSSANVLLAGLGFYCTDISIPQISQAEYPSRVRIQLKTDGASDFPHPSDLLLLLPALISEKMGHISRDQIWPAVMSMLDRSCGSEVYENSCALLDVTALPIGTEVTIKNDEDTPFQVNSEEISGGFLFVTNQVDNTTTKIHKSQIVRSEKEKRCPCGACFALHDGRPSPQYAACFYPNSN